MNKEFLKRWSKSLNEDIEKMEKETENLKEYKERVDDAILNEFTTADGICQNCGAGTDMIWKFCPNCGSYLGVGNEKL